MISLDTNVVLRFLIDDVPLQTEKVKVLLAKHQVYITDIVVSEAVYVMEKSIGITRNDIADLLKDFLEFSNVVYNPRCLPGAIALYEKHPALSFVDCYCAVEVTVSGNKLATFDKKL